VRVFKSRLFAKFARSERLADEALSKAIDEAEGGLIAADLGGGVIKQRVARAGQGKRGGYRVLIAFRSRNLSVFMFGFAKNEMDNIDAKQLATLQDAAGAWFRADGTILAKAVADGLLIEVEHGKDDKEKPADE
jgi:hypothetical protein